MRGLAEAASFAVVHPAALVQVVTVLVVVHSPTLIPVAMVSLVVAPGGTVAPRIGVFEGVHTATPAVVQVPSQVTTVA